MTTLNTLASDPALADLLMIGARVGEGPIAALHQERLGAYGALLHRARLSSDPDIRPAPSPSVEKPIVSALASLIAKRVAAGEADKLPELLSGLHHFTLTAYLGSDEST